MMYQFVYCTTVFLIFLYPKHAQNLEATINYMQSLHALDIAVG